MDLTVSPPRRAQRRERTSLTVAAALAALVAAPFVAREAKGALFGAPVAAADMVAELPAAAIAKAAHLRLAAQSVAGTGSHLGFDTHSYPGDRAMQAWRATYEWVGFYLPAPCHKDDSWSGTRPALARMNYGVAVIYVGQQTWSDYKPLSRAQQAAAKANGAQCLPEFVSGARGHAEANDAIARTAAEGFPAGTVIYLDLERMDVVPERMRQYYREWTARVLEDGRYVPGVYAHTYNADLVYRDVRGVYASAGIDADPPFWVAGGRGFHRDVSPSDVGHTFAHTWQGVLDVVERRNGFKLPIDVNVAAVASPSGVLAMVD
jgi:hypothetical protein